MVQEVVLGHLVRGGARQNRVALEEVAVATRRGAAIPRVLSDLVGTDSGGGPVEEAVVLGGGVAMKQLRRGRGREAEHERQGREGEGDLLHAPRTCMGIARVPGGHNGPMSETPGASGVEAVRRLFANTDAPLRVEDRGSSIELTPTEPETFGVTVYDQGDDAMIAAGRWHAHFDDPTQLAWCALLLLTPFYRLVEEHKGGVLVAIWVERYTASGWQGFEPVFYLNPNDTPSWRPQGEETFARRYHQQWAVDLPMPYDDLEPNADLKDGLPPDFQSGRRLVYDREPHALGLA